MGSFAPLCVTALLLLVQVSALTPKEMCLLPVDEGPCRALLPRFYYNRYTQQCEEFSYGGCGGNPNNFPTFEDCEKSCWKIPKVPKVCRLDMDEGQCRAILKRYFFNFTSMQCEAFEYGGCLGNDNRFMDKKSCSEKCEPQKSVPLLCLDPLDAGSCSAALPRYYYNQNSKSCVEFIYTGCGGNNNNFVDQQSCTRVCIKGRKLKTDFPIRRLIKVKRKKVSP
ncbi:tissue factor pathway inhibitor 2 [Amia ocellicauda]|uniref:tissue factor pathway inhibitor 2 n=1 Tax=Amia ocellicauda TaxID=2972642 RepID=UPI003463B169